MFTWLEIFVQQIALHLEIMRLNTEDDELSLSRNP